MAAAVVVLGAMIVTLVGPGPPPAGAVSYSTDSTSPVALWRDGEDRVHGAWAKARNLVGDVPRLHLVRLTASGAPDTTFDGDGERIVTMTQPGPFCGLAAGSTARYVSFAPDGTVVVGWLTDFSLDECGRVVTIDRYSLAGARLARTSHQERTTVGATADGRIALSRSADPFTIELRDGGGSLTTTTTVGLGRIRFDQVPGGPLYVSTHLLSDEVQVRRISATGAEDLPPVTCPSALGEDRAGVVPGLGTDHAVACFRPDPTFGTGSLTVTHRGASSWTRTIAGRASVEVVGHTLGEGRVVVGGACVRLEACEFQGFTRFGATGPLDQLDTGAYDGVDRTLPIDADGFAWGRYVENDEGTIRFAEVDRVSFGSTGPTVPAAPAAPVGVAGDRQVSVSWSPPAVGGSPISGYRITPYRDGLAQAPIVVGNVTSRVVTGLVNGSSYRFSVAAINAVGRGPESPLSVVVVPGAVPGAPTNVRAVMSASRSATVTWSAPLAVPGLPVTRYEMVVVADGVRLQAVNIGAGTSEVVSSLTPGVIYAFEVRAVNAVGAGAWSALSNPVTPVRAPFRSHTAAAERLSNEMLGRAPTSAERASWAGRMETGQISPGGLVAELRDSSDNLQRVDPVVRLYQAYFLRRPDAGGLDYWVAQRRGGRSLQSISDFFRRSAEFTALYGTLSNRQFVELIYTNILGRPGEPSGIAYWTGELDSGRRSRGSVMVGFSEAAEYRNAQASEVDTSVLYILLLGRTPTAAEYAMEVAYLDGGGTVAALADRLIATTDYANRT